MGGHIVCGIDGVPDTSRAAAVAARLARDLGCTAVLAHVEVQDETSAGVGAASVAYVRELGRVRALMDRHGFPRGTSARLTRGEPAEALLEITNAHDAELVVVGSRGRLEVGRALLGSVSSTLMRTAPCPVVVVPPSASVPFESDRLRSVVCGVEGPDAAQRLLRLGADLVDRLGGTLHAVHAFDPGRVSPGTGGIAPALLPQLREVAEARLESALAEAGVSARRGVVALPPAEAIARVAKEVQAGLIVAGSHGRGRLGSILHGSVTIRLAATSPAPLVVLPPDTRLAPGSGHYELSAEAA